MPKMKIYVLGNGRDAIHGWVIKMNLWPILIKISDGEIKYVMMKNDIIKRISRSVYYKKQINEKKDTAHVSLKEFKRSCKYIINNFFEGDSIYLHFHDCPVWWCSFRVSFKQVFFYLLICRFSWSRIKQWVLFPPNRVFKIYNLFKQSNLVFTVINPSIAVCLYYFILVNRRCLDYLWKSHSNFDLNHVNYPFKLKYDCSLWLK